MPTFQSIRIHPRVKEILEKKVHPSITTPQALLSRDPIVLSQSLNVPLDEILKLRSLVADALTLRRVESNNTNSNANKNENNNNKDDFSPSSTSTAGARNVGDVVTGGGGGNCGIGQRSLHIKATVSLLKRREQQQQKLYHQQQKNQSQEEEEDENDIPMTTKTYSQSSHSSSSSSSTRKVDEPKSFICGSVSALDLCLYESSLNFNSIIDNDNNNNNNNEQQHFQHYQQQLSCPISYISTGSTKLDKLLSSSLSFIPKNHPLKKINSTTQEHQRRGGKKRKLPTSDVVDTGQQMQEGVDSISVSAISGATCSRTSYESTSGSSKGGIPFGYVTQITGPPSCGKTQLALYISSLHSLSSSSVGNQQHQRKTQLQQHNDNTSVYYIASGVGHGSMTSLVRRMYHFIGGNKNNSNNNKINIKQILRSIKFITVKNAYETLASLTEIEQSLQRMITIKIQKQQHEQQPPQPLIVLDSASGCLSNDLYSSMDTSSTDNSSSNSNVGMSLLQEVSLTIKRISRQYYVAVLVTNGTVSNNKTNNNKNSISSNIIGFSSHDNMLKPAMGQLWNNSIADIHLWLSPSPSTTATNKDDDIQKQQRQQLSCGSSKVITVALEYPIKSTCNNHPTNDNCQAQFIIASTGIQDP